MPGLLKLRRFTVDESHRMGAAGILSEDDRVELIEGEIVEMTPIGLRHAGTVDATARIFASRLGEQVIVRVRNPVVPAADRSEIQPDVALLRVRADLYRHAHPAPRDVYLIVEIADASVKRDRRVKLPLYARAGVPEVWLVDLNTERVEVHREPSPGGYRSVKAVPRGEVLTAEAFPDVRVAVVDILG
jgi:Uma2 family endonuclease